MGYRISTFKNLPVHHDFYFILIGDYKINDRINNLFRDDFNYIADNISDSAIVQSSNRQNLEREICESLVDLIDKSNDLGKLINSIETDLPGLLILDEHLSEINKNSLIIFIAFNKLSDIYMDNNELITDLKALASGRNKNIIDKVQNKGSFVTKIKDALILQPNISGFGINLRKLLK